MEKKFCGEYQLGRNFDFTFTLIFPFVFIVKFNVEVNVKFQVKVKINLKIESKVKLQNSNIQNEFFQVENFDFDYSKKYEQVGREFHKMKEKYLSKRKVHSSCSLSVPHWCNLWPHKKAEIKKHQWLISVFLVRENFFFNIFFSEVNKFYDPSTQSPWEVRNVGS